MSADNQDRMATGDHSNLREPARFDRLKTLMPRLTDITVLADLLHPVTRTLARVRQAAVGRTLIMPDFIALGVLRHLQGMSTLREPLQRRIDRHR